MAAHIEEKALQRAVFIAVIGLIGVLAIQPGKGDIAGALLIGVAVAYGIFRAIHDHHKAGDHRKAAMAFAKSLAVLGLLLLVVGTITLSTRGTPLAAIDIAAGAGMLVYGWRRYISLRA